MDCTDALADENPSKPLWKESWKAMEKLYLEGEILAIGVSNFNIELLRESCGLNSNADEIEIIPMIVQNYFSLEEQDDQIIIDFAKKMNIHYQSYALLRGLKSEHKFLLKKEPLKMKIKENLSLHAKVLQWALYTKEIGVLPRTNKIKKLQEDYEAIIALSINS